MATAAKNGERWVTIKKEGPLHGRHILIDGKGNIVGGKVPKAFQGHHIGKLSGIKHDDSTSHYDSYSHDELKEIHKDFKEHHEGMKKELHDDMHGQAKSMRDEEANASDEVNLLKKIRAKGGVNVGDAHQAATEFKESIHPGVRKAISKKDSGMSLDQMADELGMSRNDLMDKLSGIEPDKYTKIEDYHDKAKKSMPDYEDRKKAIDDLGQHVTAIEAAKNRKEHAASKEKADAEAKKKQDPKSRSVKVQDAGENAGAKGEKIPPKPADNEAVDSIDKHNALLKKYAQKFGSAEEFEKNIKGGMGQKSIGDLFGMVDANSDNHLDANGIKSALSEGGEHYFLSKVDPKKLKIQDEGDLPRKVHDTFDQSKAKPIIVGKDGNIIDGRHRTTAAKNSGAKSINAYISAKDFYNQHVGGGDKSTGPATTADDSKSTGPATTADDSVKRRGDRLDGLHDDVSKYMQGEGDANELLKKHDRLFQAMARNVAEKRGGEAEDLAQEGRTAAFKTLEALKNGTQKPKEGQHLGEHMLRRIKQGLSEGARQSNERPMSRESSKLAALVNSHKTAHTNETGQEPSEDDLFGRVSRDDGFNKAKFSAPGTKKNIEDPREKFDALRGAMKNQKSQTTLDESSTDDEGGNMGTKSSQIADKGETPEQAVLRKEAEQEMSARKDQVHDVLSQFGLSPGERHAVVHRFGVGHADATGAVLPWDKVAEHMGKDMKKQVNPETAKKHFNNGRAKLHKHIGDERMGLLMQKSLIGDVGVHLLIKQIYELGLYDILKSHDLHEQDVLESFAVRTVVAPSYPELIKSLEAPEYVGEYQQWSDGSISASIIQYKLRR